MHHGTRDELLDRLAEAVGAATVAHPTRVAIDGPPAAGKTTLADELAGVLRTQGRAVIRATIDDFLFPRARRYPRGEYSAEGRYGPPGRSRRHRRAQRQAPAAGLGDA